MLIHPRRAMRLQALLLIADSLWLPGCSPSPASVSVTNSSSLTLRPPL